MIILIERTFNTRIKNRFNVFYTLLKIIIFVKLKIKIMEKEKEKELHQLTLARNIVKFFDFVPEYSDNVLQLVVDEEVYFYSVDFLKSVCEKYDGWGCDCIEESICNIVQQFIEKKYIKN